MGAYHRRYPFLDAAGFGIVQDSHRVGIVCHLLTCINQRLIFLVSVLTVTLNSLTKLLAVLLTLLLFTDAGFLGLTPALLFAFGGFYFRLTCCSLIVHLLLDCLVYVLPLLDDGLLLLLLTLDLHA